LFRRSPEIYFVSRVHELVEYRIHELGLKLRPSEFYIHHFGQLSEKEFRETKAARYHHLLQLKIEDQPNDPAAWVQLGLEEYEGRKDTQQALMCFQKALALEPRAAQAWFFTGMIQLELGDYKGALSAFERARGDDNNRAMMAHLRGDALHNLGQLDEARKAYLRALELIPDDPILMSKLGFTEVRVNRVQAGLDLLRRACLAAPDVAEIQERLMKAYIVVDNLPQAAEHAEIVASLENTPKWFLRAASVRLKLKQVDRAKEILRRAVERLPDVPELQDALTGLGSARSAPE
jgi:tetratricopeptide (TPR) repeat protein